MIAWFRYICLIVSLIITLPELLSAQRLVSQRQEDVEAGLLYNESVYILSNYSCLSSNSPGKTFFGRVAAEADRRLLFLFEAGYGDKCIATKET